MEWATRCPAVDGDVIEVRQVYEMSDYEDERDAESPSVHRRRCRRALTPARDRRRVADRVGRG